MKLTFGLLLLALIYWIKRGRIKDFINDLRSDKSKWKAIRDFVHKSPYFAVLVLFFFGSLVDELVSGPKNPIHFTTALLTIELLYLIPVAIGLYFMKKKGGGGGKAHVRGATVISSDQLSAQLKNNVSEECLPITPGQNPETY